MREKHAKVSHILSTKYNGIFAYVEINLLTTLDDDALDKWPKASFVNLKFSA